MVQFLKGSLARGHYKELYKGLELSVECQASRINLGRIPFAFHRPFRQTHRFSSALWGFKTPNIPKKIVFHPPNLPTSSVWKLPQDQDATIAQIQQGNGILTLREGHFFGTRFLGEFLSTPPVEADPRVEYNFLEMASNGPVEQIIFLQQVGSVFEHFLFSIIKIHQFF